MPLRVFFRDARLLFKLDSLGKEILHLAVPAALAVAADPIASLIGTAFIGHIGPVELAAAGVSDFAYSADGLAVSVQAILACAFAEKDYKKAIAAATRVIQVDLLWLNPKFNKAVLEPPRWRRPRALKP